MPAEPSKTPAKPAEQARAHKKAEGQAASASTEAAQSTGPVASEPAPVRAYTKPWIVAGFILLTVFLLATDLVIKSWAFEHVAGVPVVLDTTGQHDPQIPRHQAKVVVPHVLSLYLTTNPGAVFGLGKGAKPLFVTVSIIAVGVVGFLFLRSAANAWWFHLGLAMVLSGALGNLYDRLMYSAVRDMFFLFPDMHLPFGLKWPGGMTGLYPWIFNFADVALVVGVILLGMLSWYYDRQRQIASQAQS